LEVKVSSLIEHNATDEQKENGYDLADYLISQQRQINEKNEFIDSYNKIETVLNDEILLNNFHTILDEQKAIVIYNNELSELEAERLCARVENIRAVILSV